MTTIIKVSLTITTLIIIVVIAKLFNKLKYKINTNKGIQCSKYVQIGDIEQYIQIRGEDIDNPIVIVIHGGPGNNMGDISCFWQKELEKDYTFINWDQRGCGNTFYRNNVYQLPIIDLLVSDLDELVDYVCAEYNKSKVIIMGHSFGTFIGGIYATKYPEKLLAYVSVSQMIDFKETEKVSAAQAIKLGKEKNKMEYVNKVQEKLQVIMSYNIMYCEEAKEFLKFRQMKEKYLPKQFSNKILFYKLFSPYMTFYEAKWFFNFTDHIENNRCVYEELLTEGKLSMYNYNLNFEIPVIFIVGENDWTTPGEMIKEYYNKIKAPVTRFVTINNTGHLPFLDNKKEFSNTLLGVLNKLLKDN